MSALQSKLLAMIDKRRLSVKHAESRLAALDAGQLKYQGAMCLQGHDGLRYVKQDSCIHCVAHEPALRPPLPGKKPYNHGLPRKSRR